MIKNMYYLLMIIIAGIVVTVLLFLPSTLACAITGSISCTSIVLVFVALLITAVITIFKLVDKRP